MVDRCEFFLELAPYEDSLGVPSTVQGLHFELNNELLAISEAFRVMNADYRNFLVHRGYGAVAQTTSVPLPDITAAFQTLPVNASLANSKCVEYDLANNAFSFKTPGTWRNSVTGAITFTDVNAGRTFDVQLYNIVDATAVLQTTVYVGRNQDGFNIALSRLLPVEPVNLDDNLVIRIGNASTNFTGVNLLNLSVDVNRVSEVRI